MMHDDDQSYQCSTQNCKRRKLTELTLEEKLGIADDIINKMDYHDNVSARYRVRRESICGLLRSLKKDPAYLQKLHEKEKSKSNKDNLIVESVSRMMEQGNTIKNIHSIREEIMV